MKILRTASPVLLVLIKERVQLRDLNKNLLQPIFFQTSVQVVKGSGPKTT